LQKALSKKPEDRFESCTAFVKAMEKKPEARQPVQQQKMVEPPKLGISSGDSIQPEHKLQMSVADTKSPKKRSGCWKWFLGTMVLLGILALIAGLSAEREKTHPLTVNSYQQALTVNSYQQGEDRVVELNGVKMVLKHIKTETFMMGSPTSEDDRGSDERQHHVTLTKDYWLGETEVTQEQYKAVMGQNPSYFTKGGAYPVENVSWTDAMAFCERLTKAERANGNLPEGYEYTLPTEAQWEYAGRGGHNNNQYHIYSGGDEINDVAWYYDNSNSSTHPVGQKRANELGLYDMSGNVLEWCRDSCDWNSGVVTDNYRDDIMDPLCTNGSYRVLRGGSWIDNARNCRSAYRYSSDPAYRSNYIGFRVALASVQ